MEAIELLEWQEVQNEISLPLLIDRLKWAQANSPYWRSFFARHQFNVHEVKTLDDFRQLPLVDKPQFLDDQQSHNNIGGTLLAVPMDDVQRIHRTSGSTNVPLMVLLTANDASNAAKIGARALRCAGLRPDDVVIHCLNYSMWSGGVTDHMCYEQAGAAVIPYGVGSSRFLIETIKKLRPSVISCTPSYLFKLYELCTQELDVYPETLGLRAAFLGGEGGLQSVEYRNKVENQWHLKAIDANYGLSEVLSIFGAECEHRRGLHFHGQGVLLPELVDTNGQVIEIAPGNQGELVLSTLLREAQPLFRFRTHDQIEIIDTSCPCGRKGFLFKVLSRTDDMMVIKGINFYPAAIQGIVAQFGDDLSGEYRVLKPSNKDQLPIVEAEVCHDEVDRQLIQSQLTKTIQIELSVSVEVNLIDHNTLPRSANKNKRVHKTS